MVANLQKQTDGPNDLIGLPPYVVLNTLLKENALIDMAQTKQGAITALFENGEILAETYEATLRGYGISGASKTAEKSSSASVEQPVSQQPTEDTILAALTNDVRVLVQFLNQGAKEALRQTLSSFVKMRELPNINVDKLVERIGEMAQTTLQKATAAQAAQHGVAAPMMFTNPSSTSRPQAAATPASPATTQASSDDPQHLIAPDLHFAQKGPAPK